MATIFAPSEFLAKTYRFATIHNVTDDRQTTHCGSCSAALLLHRPLCLGPIR